jgi:hypothetical protein
LKSDLEKYGRATTKGKLRDALNGAKRYLSSNFRDDQKQHGIDLLLGVGLGEGGDGKRAVVESWLAEGMLDCGVNPEPVEVMHNTDASGFNTARRTTAITDDDARGRMPPGISVFARMRQRHRVVDMHNSLQPSSPEEETPPSQVDPDMSGNEPLNTYKSLQQIERVLQQRNSRWTSALRMWKPQHVNSMSIGSSSVNTSGTSSIKAAMPPIETTSNRSNRSGRVQSAPRSVRMDAEPKLESKTRVRKKGNTTRIDLSTSKKVAKERISYDINRNEITATDASLWQKSLPFAKKTVIFLSSFIFTLFGSTFM